MSDVHEWADLADAVFTHDHGRELSIWRDLLCIDCRTDTVIPGEHHCVECFIRVVQGRGAA